MSVRGSRFLPDDELLFVALDLVCGGCGIHLDRWKVTTSNDRYEEESVSHTRGWPVVEEQIIREDGSRRFRYRITCPCCPNRSRPLREDTIEKALHALYAPGARAKVVKHAI